MVVLGERKGSALSEERELEIWRFANNDSKFLPGSYPGRLALYALQEGLAVEVFEDRPRLEKVFSLSTVQDRFPGIDLKKALEEHDRYLQEAETKGIPVHRSPLSLESLADLAESRKILLLVSTAPDVSGLHWVLIQSFKPSSREIVLMDPALGQNFYAPLERFLDHYTRIHPFLGVAIAI